MVQILGDIHGNFQKLYMKAMAVKDTTIIQVGDFGVGFRSRARMDEEMVDINKKLAKNIISEPMVLLLESVPLGLMNMVLSDFPIMSIVFIF